LGQTPRPDLNEIAANGGPATTPSLRAMLTAWAIVTAAADPWLDALTAADLIEPLPGPGPRRTIGSALLRVTYHYWFHTGEILAVRQVLGHRRLPEFVGDIDGAAPYRPG
ncbi:MAG TPA: DinB family protein, partial [Candidatus Deferrimicrobium sp.]|nr:DinB family protein [Candidatus Deferrimicrobium sp.]